MKRILLAACFAFGLLALSSCHKNGDLYFSYSVTVEDGFAKAHPQAVLYFKEYRNDNSTYGEFLGVRDWVKVSSGVVKEYVISHEDASEFVKIQYTEGLAEEHWIKSAYKLVKGKNVAIILSERTQTSDSEPMIPN